MKNILIYNSGGGLGDSIQLIPLILSLKSHYKKTKFYYLGAHSNHFSGKLKEYSIDIKTLNLDLKYFGFRWWHLFFVKSRFEQKNFQKFDLIIDLQTKLRNSLILKLIPHSLFYSKTFNYLLSSKKNKIKSIDIIEDLSIFLEEKIKLVEFKTNQLPKQLIKESKRLLPNSNYIGFSLTQGNVYRKKSWSTKNFIELASKITDKNKTPVFFIEKKNTVLINEIKTKLPSALFPESHSSISCPALVTALSTRLELGISIDNGVMHMMGLANIPMIVLFGPTDSEKFAPKINSIKILDSKKIYKSKNINTISVYDVFKLI